MDATKPPSAAESLKGTRFRDRALEREYRLEFLASDGRTTAVVALLWLIPVVVPVSAEAIITGADAALPPWAIGLRALYLVSLAAVAWLAPRQRDPAWLDALVFGFVLLASGATLVTHAALPAGDFRFLITDAVPVIALWTLVPNRFALQGLAALLVSARTLLVLALFREPAAPGLWSTICIALLAANVMGAALSWMFHRARRAQFLARRAETSAREALEAALAQVRTLRGLVPMCTTCKAIRTPDGTWRRLEEVLTRQTEAQLTHGLCDACLERLYPE